MLSNILIDTVRFNTEENDIYKLIISSSIKFQATYFLLIK